MDPLKLLYQDEHIVAVEKPSGLMVHPSAADRYATDTAFGRLRGQLKQHVYPVHRLDRSTSGVLVFALSPFSARAMSDLFAVGKVKKEYLAVVRGIFPKAVNLSYPLKEELDEKTDAKARRDKPAQEAITHLSCQVTYEIPEQVDKYPTSRYSLVRAYPQTGRKHQIRRHLRHLGHPIIGDVNHGSGKHNKFFETRFGIKRLWLASTVVQFIHPVNGVFIRVEAPLATEFVGLLKQLETFKILAAKS